MRTDQEIVAQTEELARRLSRESGWDIIATPYHTSPNPHAREYWRMACIAQELLTRADVQACIDNLAKTVITDAQYEAGRQVKLKVTSFVTAPGEAHVLLARGELAALYHAMKEAE